MNYKTYANLTDDIRDNLSKITPMDFDLIVGLPRSGMIPAYMIALFLNINCTDLNSFIANRPLKRGSTRKYRNDITKPHDAKNVLIVDDTIDTGASMTKDVASIPQEMQSKITTSAIYSSIKSRKDIDIYFKYVPLPCVFEWNILHHGVIKESCLDIDGVLCVDPTKEQDDDGPQYLDFLKNAQPFILPSTKAHALVTSRLEKYRPETEAWLKKHNIAYDHLIMMDIPTLKERKKIGGAGHKADYYKKSNSKLFIESDPYQAQEISKLSGKIVYCSQDNRLYHPSYRSAIRNPHSMRNYAIEQTKNVLRPVKRFVQQRLKFKVRFN